MEISIEGVITLLFSGIVAYSTFKYTRLTKSLVNETRQSRAFFLESHIAAYLVNSETQPGIISLVIKNIGKGIARNISFEVINDINYSKAANTLSTISIFNNGVSYFPPDKKFKFILFDVTGDDNKLKDKISFVVRYSDSVQENRVARFELFFSEISNLGKVTPSDTFIGQIAEELKKIRETVEKT